MSNPNPPAPAASRPARAAAAAAPAGAAQWPAFVGTNNGAVNNWIAAIEARWPTLQQRQAIRAHANRWGPNQDPYNTHPQQARDTRHEDSARTKCFRQAGNLPKCHSCWAGNRTPSFARQADLPIGLDQGPDRMPCGCDWQMAMVELWTIWIGGLIERQPRNRRLIALPLSSRIWMYMTMRILLGGARHVTWRNLCRRSNLTRAITNHGFSLHTNGWAPETAGVAAAPRSQ